MQTIDAETCAKMILEGRCAVLSGAGVSTAAGIPDFRGPKGLYVTRQYDPNTIFDIDCFRHDPQPFFDFSRDFLGALQSVTPTFTHKFLAALEADGLLDAVITQNIDPLHQQSGTHHIICLHGNYFTSHCQSCEMEYDFTHLRSKLHAQAIPECDHCSGVIKPDVVFFGEAVYGMDEAGGIVHNSNTLLVLGSSLAVYPAATLPQFAGRTIVVNQGAVNLSPDSGRYHVQSDLDAFFLDVAHSINCEHVKQLLDSDN